MVRTPDGHNKLELMSYHSPKMVEGDSNASVNALGLRRLLFAVDDIDATLTRLRAHGAEGIMIALAEENANG